MKNKHRLIKGDYFFDERGSVSFINDFMLNPIVRFYEIIPKNTSIVRAWQAHKKESKWFYCSYGSFKVNLIELDCFENPSSDLTIHSYELNANNSQILYIPPGHANGFKALTQGSKLIVFSDFDLESSKDDDYRFDIDKWKHKL